MLGNYKLGAPVSSSNPTTNPNEVLGTTYKTLLAQFITDLQTNIFTVIRYQILMEARDSSTTDNKNYTIYSQTQLGTVTTEQKTFTDSIFAYIT